MKLLLDTQCWLWWFSQPERLSEEAIKQIADETNQVWLSVAIQLGAQSLEIKASHALQASALPLFHRDPFDRMLIAQSQIEGMTLVSADSMFDRYDVSVIWAAS